MPGKGSRAAKRYGQSGAGKPQAAAPAAEAAAAPDAGAKEDKAGEVNTTRIGDVDLKHGAHVGWKRETETEVEGEGGAGGGKNIRGTEGKFGVNDGKLDGEVARVYRSEDAQGNASELQTSIGLEDNELTGAVTTKTERKVKVVEDGFAGHPQEVERTTSTSNRFHGGVGLDGGSLGNTHTRVDERGRENKTDASLKVEEGNVTAAASHQIKTESGNYVTVSAKGEDKVIASEPEKVGDRWVVTYRHTTGGSLSGGGGTAHTGGTASVGGGRFEEGTRVFESKEEADEFKEHAAEKIGVPIDPTSVQGAMSIPIGESRGTGGSHEASVGGSASVSGAHAGVTEHGSKTHQVDVFRVSEHVVQVTWKKSTETGHDVEVGGIGTAATAGSADGHHTSLTAEFDLSTPEGKRAFEKFCDDHRAPTVGGALISSGHGKSHDDHQGLSLPVLGDAKWAGTTAEEHVKDRQGTHDSYSGQRDEDYHPGKVMRWLGEENQHASVEIVGTENNGHFDDYRMEASFSGDEGDFVRSRMASLTNAGRSKGAAGSVSGNWKLSAAIPKKRIAELEHFYRTYPRKLPGPEGELQMAIRAAKSKDDVMRAIAKHVADNADPSGVASGGAVDPSAGARDVGSGALDWTVELEGDPNFPGERGQKEIETKIRHYGEQLARGKGRGAAELVTALDGEVQALEGRREHVADRTKYTDLPDALRASEIARIDNAIHSFEFLRHQAIVLATRNNPNESQGQRLGRVYSLNMQGYKGMDGPHAELAKLRDEIAIQDSLIADNKKTVRQDLAALRHASRHGIDWRYGQAAAEDQSELKDELTTQSARTGQQDAAYATLDGARVKFLAALHDPAQAIPLGRIVLSTLKMIGSQLLDVDASLMSRADRHARFMTRRERGAQAAFWDRMGVTDDQVDIGDGTGVGPTSMQLDEGETKRR